MSDRLTEACKALNGTELWVDDNSPWRIMLKRNGSNVAVAEQHPNSAHGDGEWADGNAICAIVNEAIRSCTTAPSLPVDAGEGRVPAGVLVEIEALEGTAAKIRRGASGYRVAAWVEMSVRGLRAALTAALATRT